MGDSQLSLISRFSDGVRKSRVHSICFSQPFAKLQALLIAEMIDKGEESPKVKLNDYNKALSGRQTTISSAERHCSKKIDRHYSKKIDRQCSRKSGVTVAVKGKIRGRRVRTRIDDDCAASIKRASLASIDRHLTVPIDRASRIVLKILKWVNLTTIHTCGDCLKEPKLTSNTKPDTTACLGAWYTWDRILQTSLEGSGTFWRNMVILEPFEVNQHPVAEVLPILLKIGQSASREEVIEEMKDCRSMYIHMSTRSSKGIWLLLVEPLDLERVIHKSKRAVDTLQAEIGSVEIQLSIDPVHPTSIDTVHPMSIDTVHPTSIDTVHRRRLTLFTRR
uniref:Uncharacterized protein n=1 Tax=Brassica oleracea var. oleracea TaxID=109376 RepID=A0A0D3BVK4_BRAOL